MPSIASGVAVTLRKDSEILVRDEKFERKFGSDHDAAFETYVLPGSTAPIITWQNLTIETSQRVDTFRAHLSKLIGGSGDHEVKSKIILDNVSGQIQGGLHAVIGASGLSSLVFRLCFSHLLTAHALQVLERHLCLTPSPAAWILLVWSDVVILS